MKRLLIGGAFIMLSFQTQPKRLKVEGDITQWQNVLNVIDQSDATAKERIAARTLIIEQLNRQLADTTKHK